MLRTWRKVAASVLCALMALAAPGPGAYAAAAQAVEAPVEPLAPAAPLPVLSPVLGELPPLLSAPALEIAHLEAPASAIPAAAAQSSAQSAAPAASALAQARGALAAPQAAPRAAAPSLESAGQAGRVAFDAVAPARTAESDFVEPEGEPAAQTVFLSRPGRAEARKAAAPRASVRVLATRARAAAARLAPRAALGMAGAAVLAFVAPHLAAGGVLVPLVMGTCNSMRERAIKDATILPQQNTQREIATKELDAILVNFGKRLKEEAAKDARVKSAVSAHNAEHAMETPLLDLLPAWKERFARGTGPTVQEAYAEYRAAILARLASTTLKNETPEVIEELLDKTGSWDAFAAWEAKHQVLDNLKKAAESDAAGKAVDKINEKQRENTGGASGGGGAVLGALLVLGAGLALHGLLGWGGGALGMAMIAATIGEKSAEAPAQAAVPLDTYLNKLGLSKEEADFLKGFTIDLGARDLAPIVGRSKELKRVITILSKPAGTQNNPMILGDKGVGKTAIVEAVAKYLYYDKLPSLKGKRILELDTGRLMAGSGKVGEMEERLMKLRSILAKTNNQVVLFVDEIHSILKNVTTSSSVPDLLKSPLRNGEMTVIGATTMGEFRKYVEQDPAFADRFDTVQVDEPTQDEAVEMLEGDLEYLERKFDVEIDPEAAKAAVKLSARYIPEKFLPRKARVLLESAIAEAKPEAARDGVRVQIDQLTDRLRIFVKRYAALKAQKDESKRTEEIQLYNKIVSIYTTILALDEKSNSFVNEKITKNHVMATLSKETGIAVGELGEDEYKRLLTMEPWFKERIVGQDDAIKAIADTVRTNKSGLSDPNRPQGVFMFAGKTGVGKTALTRTLAEFLFSDPEAVIRLDMSEYMEKFAVQRLFGAPPGYVGYDSGGELTEKVRRKPYSVVLIDEIEKAHPDVLNALLQVFDAGRMTDGKQNTVNFKNTIIIMTTNLGASAPGEGAAFKSEVLETIKQRLRPEFVNRVDKIVVFNPIDVAQAESITKIMLKDVEKRLREQDLDIKVAPEAVAWLANKGFDANYGARPLKRVVESDVTNKISGFLLKQKSEGALVNGGVIEISVKDDALDFQLKPNPPPALEPMPLPDGPLGAKLRRVLDEAVRGPDAVKDAGTFESLLFPDRKAVTLSEPMGAFRPNAEPDRAGGEPDSVTTILGDEAAGLKDAQLEALKGELASKLEGRWDGAAGEAAPAWLDVFARLGKELSKERVSVQSRVPDSKLAGKVELALFARGDSGFAAGQRLARLFRDHFSTPVPDEDAVRARAAQLKDEGLSPDRDLLDLKRLVESVPGATFGYDVNDGFWRFWLRLPVTAKAVAETPAAAAPDQTKPSAAPEPAAEAPVTALDARLSPAKMFLFLTQRAPEGMRQRRALTADLLDSKSTQARLIGLHMAASLLEPSALREVASASRMLRLSDQKDYALFSRLAARVSGLPMTAQREALAEAYKTRLDSFRTDGGGRFSRDNSGETRFYGELAEPVLPLTMDAKESKATFKRLEDIRLRFTRVVRRFVGYGVLGGVAGEVGLHLAQAPLWVAIGMPIVAGLILWWICQANFGDDRSSGRDRSENFESLITPRLSQPERLRLARRRLESLSRGGASLADQAAQAELLGLALGWMKDGEKAALFGRWRATLEKGLARQKAKGPADAPVFGTLGLLARLQTRAPEKERATFSRLLLEPLRRRWLPSGSNDYLAGLAVWAADAKLSPAELEDLFGLIVNFPSNVQQATPAAFMPIYLALAGRGDLSPDMKAAFDQFLEGLAAEAAASKQPAQIAPGIELARARVKLGYESRAWAGLRETIGEWLERPDLWGGAPVYLALDRLIQEAPPKAAERQWLTRALRVAERMQNSAPVKSAAALPLSRLVKDDAERLALLLAGLREADIDKDQYGRQKVETIPALLDALRAAVSTIRDPALIASWNAAVRENAARLNAAAK